MLRKSVLSAGLGLSLLALPATAAMAQEAPEEAVDPSRLVFARATVNHVFPEGTYARIMDKSMEMVTGSMLKATGEMALRDLAAIGGMPPEKVAEMGDGTLQQVIEIMDPHYNQRMEASTRVMMREMGALMTQFEPAIREGLASAYAKRFTKAELMDLNAFFATPTGKAYAADSMILFMDPSVMGKMQEFMPVMMKQMPAVMEKVKAAVEGLPAPRKLAELSAGERQRLADLLGVEESELESLRSIPGQPQED